MSFIDWFGDSLSTGCVQPVIERVSKDANNNLMNSFINISFISIPGNLPGNTRFCVSSFQHGNLPGNRGSPMSSKFYYVESYYTSLACLSAI